VTNVQKDIPIPSEYTFKSYDIEF